MNNLLNDELELNSKRSHLVLNKLILANRALGISLKPPQRFGWLLKCLNTFIILLCLLTGFGLYNNIRIHRHGGFPVYAETIMLIAQLKICLVKNYYFQWKHKDFYRLSYIAETSEVINNFEIFELDLVKKATLAKEIGEILQSNWSDINFQITYLAAGFFSPIIYYFFKPFVHYLYEMYYLGHRDFHLPLAYEVALPTWQLLDFEFPPFPMRFLIILFQPYLCGFITVSFDGAFIVASMHVVALMRVLRHLLHCSTDEDRVPQHLRVQYLIICVKLYARIANYHASIDRLFKNLLLMQYTTSCLIICIVLYRASLGLESDATLLFKMISYLIAISVEMVFFNFDSQKVTNECEAVQFAWYDCAWYNESLQFRYIIRMMLLFTQRTFLLNVGGFAQMSHNFFLTIMRISGNFFLLLRNVNGNS